jgi:biotin carboxylase
VERRLLILGAGRHQKDLIARAEQRGLRVVACDYYPDAPGKRLASYPEDVDALDIGQNLSIARKYGVCGVITSGTDMPLVTMAEVAAALGLPCYLTPESARTATEKPRMARAFAEHGLPRAPWREADSPTGAAQAAQALGYPVVVKPSDSQGQRGTRKVRSPAALAAAAGEALACSRARRILVERFLAGWEITASAWAKDGEIALQMVTDRVTYNPEPAIGICFQHVYPSLRAAGLATRIRELLRTVARCYDLQDAPLYVQMLVCEDGLFIVEAASRVGGGHESSLLRVATGTDVLDRLIDLALTGRSAPITDSHDESGASGHALVNFLLARTGRVRRLAGYEHLIAEKRIEEGGFYISEGHECRPIVDGQGRVGYFIARAGSRAELMARAASAYGALSAADAQGRNLLFVPAPHELLG